MRRSSGSPLAADRSDRRAGSVDTGTHITERCGDVLCLRCSFILALVSFQSPGCWRRTISWITWLFVGLSTLSGSLFVSVVSSLVSHLLFFLVIFSFTLPSLLLLDFFLVNQTTPHCFLFSFIYFLFLCARLNWQVSNAISFRIVSYRIYRIV